MSNKTQIQFHPSRADPRKACGQPAHTTSLTSIFSAFLMLIISFIAQFGLFILQINYISFIYFARLGGVVEEKLERNQRPWLCESQRLVFVDLGRGSFFQGSLG